MGRRGGLPLPSRLAVPALNVSPAAQAQAARRLRELGLTPSALQGDQEPAIRNLLNDIRARSPKKITVRLTLRHPWWACIVLHSPHFAACLTLRPTCPRIKDRV